MKSLATTTTVEANKHLYNDVVRIDGRVASGREMRRVKTVLDRLRAIAKNHSVSLRVESRNPEVSGKGLGFSASGFAALGLSTSRALGLNLVERELSEVVRLGAGSAARSLVGGFSIWYANKRGRSYAEQLAPANAVGLETIIVPIRSTVKTDTAHEDAVKSPLYSARLRYVQKMLGRMKRAIAMRDVDSVSRLAEEDTLNLHAITMTGPNHMLLFSPVSIMIMDEVRMMREADQIPAWFSLDTGPSVFVNTTRKALPRVRRRLEKITRDLEVSSPGGPAHLIGNHLF